MVLKYYFSVLFFGFLLAPITATAQNPSYSYSGSFEADIENYQNGKLESTGHVIYSNRYYSYTSKAAQVGAISSTLFTDGNDSEVLWENINIDKFKNRYHSRSVTYLMLLSREARLKGVEVTAAKYSLPVEVVREQMKLKHQTQNLIIEGMELSTHAPAILKTREGSQIVISKLPVHKVVGDQLCSAMTETSPQMKATCWFLPKEKLVMSYEVQATSKDPRQPPLSLLYLVKNFKFLKSVPKTIFLLPAGATVNIPTILANHTFPKGVIVKRIPGKGTGAMLGIEGLGTHPNGPISVGGPQ